MPEISRFLGIIVYMYYKDHPPAHFIEHLEIIEGSLPNRVVSLVLEWAFLHRNELQMDWDLSKTNHPLIKIEPLV